MWSHPGGNTVLDPALFSVQISPQNPMGQELGVGYTLAGPHITRWDVPLQLSPTGEAIIQYDITASPFLDLAGKYDLEVFAIAFDAEGNPLLTFALPSSLICIVPEPSVMVLLAGGGIALSVLRKRRANASVR